jgi:hypothetical protein
MNWRIERGGLWIEVGDGDVDTSKSSMKGTWAAGVVDGIEQVVRALIERQVDIRQPPVSSALLDALDWATDPNADED